ncbi:somatostatin-2-like [Denticeps clupeoides]|uniref:Somatostatin-2 n=1 Tax=Denticeps clupeoides TaxID=299321 RepID=A0AAY4C6N4_9TELE|nr:somatostatin-2-like [Denticeps clupeoides]
MRFCRIHSSLALVALSLVLFNHSASSQPDLDLRYHRFLQRARTAGLATQEWNKRAVEHLLSQLSLPEGESQESEVSALGDKEDVRMDLQRSIDSNSTPAKDRKAGCMNFYWKGRTSC